ncbi:MAG: amidohydrolase family protein [Pseudomonadota bacterium]|nr:amidohydrolase family protein [Pseudomonadota bacterium]
MDYDIRINNGAIFDGSGAPGYRGDVGIKDGRVTAMGKVPGKATGEIDAEGKAVTPGFVDIHTHYDAQIMWDPMLSYSPWHGVTTCVIGNCGFGIAPVRPKHREIILRTLEKVEAMSYEALTEGLNPWLFETLPEYLDVIDGAQKAINVGVLAGHTPIRLYEMGADSLERTATGEEIASMRRMVLEAIEAGAVGFSTSQSSVHIGYKGLPVPSRKANLEEILALGSALGEVGKGVIQITVGRHPWFDEFEQMARETGRPVSWTAMLTGMEGPDGHREHLRRSIAILEGGAPVYPQVACRPLQTEFQFASPFSFERISFFQPVSAVGTAGKKAIYQDPEFRRQFREAMAEDSIVGGEAAALRRSFRQMVIAECTRPELHERSLFEAADDLGIDPVDLALDLALENDLAARFRMPLLNDDEDAVEEVLRDPHTVLGLSDAGAHASQMYDTCYATHLLGYWVRERKTFPLEYAVWMLTQRPAEVFGITDRGTLKTGSPADVVVFDPVTVGAGPPVRTYDLPAGADRLISHAKGIDAVIVNGTLIRRDNEDIVDPGGALPGKLLRSGRAA